jgi:hypothetical protein
MNIKSLLIGFGLAIILALATGLSRQPDSFGATVWQDAGTSVQYLIIRENGNIAITPRLMADGKVALGSAF